MINFRVKIADGIVDFIRFMHKLKIDDYIKIDVYTNVLDVTTTSHDVRDVVSSISHQIEDNLKNK
jgi:hypothetical protein